MTILRAIGHFAGAVALAVALAGCGDDGDGDSTTTDDTAATADSAGSGSGEGGTDAAAGVYKDYSADAVADTSYDTTILFFHASWCPDCRAYEQVIQDEGVPGGVQILKVDYDTEQELRDRYGVNHQSWFVKVDSDGNELSDWFAYGEDKSVDTILEQLG